MPDDAPPVRAMLNAALLNDQSIARYARQIIVPGIGAAGQKKLLAATALVVGNRRGCEQAALYLRAAGVRVVEFNDDGSAEDFDVVVVAGVSELSVRTRHRLETWSKPQCWYDLEDHGFTAGVAPEAGLPAARETSSPDSETDAQAMHDVAACDAAAVATAILIGLPCRRESFHFES